METDTPALAKIQHLEELVCDLETAETKLKRQLQEAQRNEEDLKGKLGQLESENGAKSPSGKGTTWEEKERQFTQEQELKELRTRNEELQEELDVLRKDDNLEKMAKVKIAEKEICRLYL